MLIDILAEIHKVQPFADEKVEDGPYETLNARRGRKAQATETLSRLKSSYFNELLKIAVFIVVTGDKATEFTAAANENGKYLAANPDEFFNSIISRIPPSLYLGKESVSNLFDVVSRHIEDLAPELGIVGYPQLIFRQEYHQHFDTKEQFQHLIKRAIVNQIGGELVGIQAAKTLTEVAIKRGVAARVVPIILTTTDERFAIQISKDISQRVNPNVFLVVSGADSGLAKENFSSVLSAEPTAESVKKIFKTIEKSTKK